MSSFTESVEIYTRPPVNYQMNLIFDFCLYWETVFLQIPFQNRVLTDCESIRHSHRQILEQRRGGIFS